MGFVASATRTSQLTHLKQVTTLANSRFIEQGLESFIADGSYDRHLQRLRRKLRVQCHDLQTLLKTSFAESYFSQPKGGLCLWLAFASSVDVIQLYQQARSMGIILTPGPMFTSQPLMYRNCLRLSFAQPWNLARRHALNQVKTLLQSSTHS